jgi:hypothetical protein
MLTRDERGIIVDWLVKILLGIAIFGVIAFDAGSILVNYFTLDTASDDVAIAVSLQIGTADPRGFTDDEVYRLAREQVRSEDDGVENARVLRMGTEIDEEGIVRVRLRRVADTLIVGRIGVIENWARATANGQAGTS